MRVPRLVSASIALAMVASASTALMGCGTFTQPGYPSQSFNPNQQNYGYQRQFGRGGNGNPRINQAANVGNAGNGGPLFVQMDPLAGTDPNWATRYNPVYQQGILARADARTVMMVPANVNGGAGRAPAPAADPALGRVVEALDAMAQAQHQQQLEIERLRRGRRPAPTAP